MNYAARNGLFVILVWKLYYDRLKYIVSCRTVARYKQNNGRKRNTDIKI